jgi:cupin fold WbuC family metalloprotein
VEVLDQELIEATLARARLSSRGRVNHNFHASAGANPHRFLNAMLRGTYVVPHRHGLVPKSESFLILRGRVVVLIFDAGGKVLQAMTLAANPRGRDALGVDIEPGLWHSLIVLSREAVCYEVKPGPYDAASDKEFAPWAPAEGDPAAEAYLDTLLAEYRRLSAGD